MAQVHKHLIGTAYLDRGIYEEDIPLLEQWFRDLVDLIDMKILVEPKAIWCETEGNEGVTGVVVIDTSHSSIHAWLTEEPYLKFDLYSCKEFDVSTVLQTYKALGAYKVSYAVIDRACDHNPIIEQSSEVIFYNG